MSYRRLTSILMSVRDSIIWARLSSVGHWGSPCTTSACRKIAFRGYESHGRSSQRPHLIVCSPSARTIQAISYTSRVDAAERCRDAGARDAQGVYVELPRDAMSYAEGDSYRACCM